MNPEDIKESIERIKHFLKENIPFPLGKNKAQELLRLIYEIHRREMITVDEVLSWRKLRGILQAENIPSSKKFLRIKEVLLERRYPCTWRRGRNFTAPLQRLNLTHLPSEETPFPFYPRKIWIEEKCQNTEMAKKFPSFFPEAEVEIISDGQEVNIPFPGKREVIIGEKKGDFFKPCPCSKEVLGCGYYIFNLGFGCPYDCTYCYLQHYMNTPGLFLEAKIENSLSRFDDYWEKKRFLRIGTGEFTDSLALDPYTHYSRTLVPFFSRRKVILELKTKSANIHNLQGLNHGGKTVISWSLSPPTLVDKEEKGTASLKERLEAARKCGEEGYPVGFHFDPIIHYPGWEEEYRFIVEKALSSTRGKIAWISLGTLRFNPSLKPIIENRFPQTTIIYGELVSGEDGKMRYPPLLRVEIYKKMIEWIRERRKEVPVYLCMEPREVWNECRLPFLTRKELSEYLTGK